MGEEMHKIEVGGFVIHLTSEQIRQAFITLGKFLLKKEEEMQEIFKEETE